MVRPKAAPTRKNVQENTIEDYFGGAGQTTSQVKKKKTNNNKEYFKNSDFFIQVYHEVPSSLLLGQFHVEFHNDQPRPDPSLKLYFYVSINPSKCFFYSDAGNKEEVIMPVSCHFPFEALHALIAPYFTSVLTSATTISVYLHASPAPSVSHKFPLLSPLTSFNHKTLANAFFGTELLKDPVTPRYLDIEKLYQLLSNKSIQICISPNIHHLKKSVPFLLPESSRTNAASELPACSSSSVVATTQNDLSSELTPPPSSMESTQNGTLVQNDCLKDSESQFESHQSAIAERISEESQSDLVSEFSREEDSNNTATSDSTQVEGAATELKLEKEEVAEVEPESLDVQHPHLNPALRPYQVQAVRWMLSQEFNPHRWVDLSSLFQTLATPDGNQLYYCKYLGVFLTSLPPGDVQVSGGILADEMGLGKTVELLACILNHPRPSNQCSQPPQLEVPKEKEVDEEMVTTSVNDDKSDPKSCQRPPEELPEDETKQLELNKNLNLTPVLDSNCEENKSSNNAALAKGRCKRQSTAKVTNYRELLGSDDEEDDFISKRRSNGNNKKKKTSTKKTNPEVQTTSKSRPKRSAAKIASFKNLELATVDDDDDEDFIPDGSSRKRKSQNGTASLDQSSSSSSCLSSEDEEVTTSSRPKKKKAKKETLFAQDFAGNVSESVTGSHFECLCGNEFSRSSRKKLKRCCIECNHWHHARCIRYSGEFRTESLLCPMCWVDSYKTNPLKSKATLIVVPEVILSQWVSEISKHVSYPGFRVYVYRRRPRSHHFISPASLLAYDLVLTTYEALRAEFRYVEVSHSKNSENRSLRTPKRFLSLPCPLLGIEWWRLCLDEAQMVESISTKTAEMALRLHSVHRWCVSGTPIQRQLNDLYGLLLFLGASPYSSSSWWQATILRPHALKNTEPLKSLMSHLFWRTAKKDVEDQLGLNPPQEKVHWLNFSLVEREFYLHQFRICHRDFQIQMVKIMRDVPLSSLDHQTISKIMLPLKKLRESCSTPLLCKGTLVNISAKSNPIKDMMNSLLKKSSTECEEAHRQHIAAINGIAAVHMMREEYSNAAEKYREALAAIEEQKDNVKTDRLQQIHAMFNLTQVLDQCSDAIGRTLNDDSYKIKLAQLRKEYLSKFRAQMNSSQETLRSLTTKVAELTASFDQELWWLDLLEHLRSQDLEEALVGKVKQELINRKGIQSNTMAHMFRNLSGLSKILNNKLGTLVSLRKELVTLVEGHTREPTSSEVEAAVDCHLRPEEGKKVPKCLFCKVFKVTFAYEKSLYHNVLKLPSAAARKKLESEDEENDDEALTDSGVWAESELEVILKVIHSFAQNAKASDQLIEEGSQHGKLFDALKKEFKVLRQHWGNVTNYIAAIDELDMATTRFRLRRPDETPESTKKITYIYEPEELEPLMLKHTSDRASYLVEFKKKLGQYFYLQNLKKADYGKKGGINTDQCPICLKELGVMWSMLACGHSYCTDCLRSVINRHHFSNKIKCPLCRQTFLIKEIMHINTAGQRSGPRSEHVIKGQHSTKVEGVIHCLHNILEEDPEAKVIIFTHWKLMVEILTSALRENDIAVISWFEPQGFKKFKDPDSGIQALVLPISFGAKGLNITEANHVVLVEPFINLASEQQAIGRIYRIGQVRQTVVHRMVVWNSVEERIMDMLQPHRAKSSSSVKAEGVNFTLKQLVELFTESYPTTPCPYYET